MATPKTSFTQEQIQNLSGIAQKFGGVNNQNFQSAVNTKYGAGAFTNFLGNVKNTLKSIPPPNVVPPPNTDMPVVPTAPADIAANAKQAQFDQANPVGTAMADIKYTPQPALQAPEKVANPQTVPNAPVSGAGTVQAPVAPPAVEKTTTTTPEGTTTVQKETPGVVTPDYNLGKGREAEINANLTEGYNNDPAIQKAIASGDYNAFKNAYGYDTSDSVKKGLLDSFFQARQPKTQESFFDSLVTGLKIAKDKFIQSPEARNAQYRFDAISKYKGASSETLYNGMINGILAPGSQAYKDLVVMNGGMETPEMVFAKQKLENKQRVDRVNTEIKAQSDTNKGTETPPAPDATQTVSDKVVREKGLTWAQKYAESVSQNPELVELAASIKTDSARKKEIERVRADIYKNVIEKHPGITKGAANLLAKRESEAFDEEYNNIIDTLNVNSADLRYKTSMLEKSFDYDVKEAQDAREFKQQKDLLKYQQEIGLEGDQDKFEQQMKQKAQIAKDPVLATQDLIDTYAKMGVLPERSAQEIIQSVQNDIAGGMTLAESLSNLNKGFQSKDVYKALIAAKTQQKLISVANGSSIYDPATGTFKSATGASGNWISSVGDGKVTFYGGRVDGDVGLDIAGKEGFEVTSPVNGEAINGGFDKNYGNYLDIRATDGSRVRLSHLDENVIFQPGTKLSAGQVLGNQKNTGTVIARPGRGVLDITTWGTDGKARSGKDTEKYLTGVTAKPASSDSSNLAQGIVKGIGSLSDFTPTERPAILKELNKIIEAGNTSDKNRNAILKSAMSNKDISDTALNKIQDMETVRMQLSNLEESLKNVDVGPISGQIEKFNPYNTEAQVALAQLAGITPKVARGIFGEVGVLTDTDITNYQRTLPNLTSTEEKNALVIDFMRKLLSEGYKNAIVVQAKGGRNMTNFLDDYDLIQSVNAGGQSTSQNTAQNTPVPDNFLDIYNSIP